MFAMAEEVASLAHPVFRKKVHWASMIWVFVVAVILAIQLVIILFFRFSKRRKEAGDEVAAREKYKQSK